MYMYVLGGVFIRIQVTNAHSYLHLLIICTIYLKEKKIMADKVKDLDLEPDSHVYRSGSTSMLEGLDISFQIEASRSFHCQNHFLPQFRKAPKRQ